ncbi:hypothetical protein AURDEDRAFT_175751 [Auricularia subglabra TFB-10046 SS5]|uniref:DUF6533 domain-containing protein n=1 Tax=Auricularia subglabra (strain TFB-10046 / SS5) TaxID=717982 RepID=J0CWZ2_AURST|nr:hypothetical protein AURDEDRAFT_175751 [Auricularia subglabra TFB-10046 SS5]
MSDPAAILRELQPLFQSLARAKVVYYMHVAAICVFIYDHLTTLADEVNTIWPAPCTAGKVFFLIERYLTWPELILTLYMEFGNLEAHVCHGFFTYIVWSVVFAIVVTDMILVLRTWALWGGKRVILVSLAILLVIMTAAFSVIVAAYIKKTVFVRASQLVPSLKGCVIAQSPRRIAFGWMTLTLFELGAAVFALHKRVVLNILSVIVILTLIKGIEQFRLGYTSNLITSLYRDGILYFIYLFVLSLGNMLSIFIAPAEYVVLFAVAQRAFNAILSCRIIIHLQAAPGRDGNRATVSGNGDGLLSTMPVFAETGTQNQPCVVIPAKSQTYGSGGQPSSSRVQAGIRGLRDVPWCARF